MTAHELLKVVAAVHSATSMYTECPGPRERPDHDDDCQAMAGDLIMELRKSGLAIYKRRGAKR